MKHLAPLALLLSGCCPAVDPETPIFFDETFTELEMTQLLSVVGEWATATDRDLPPMYFDEPHGWSVAEWGLPRSVVHRMTEEEAKPLRGVARAVDILWSPNFVGLASTGGSIILAVERLRFEDISAVYRHEQGHRLGCLQHSDPPSLMVGTLGKDMRCIDAGAIELVCDVNECGERWGPTCP